MSFLRTTKWIICKEDIYAAALAASSPPASFVEN